MTQVGRRKTDAYHHLIVDILGILGESGNWQNSIRRVVAAIKASTGLDAIGIRLRNGDDFPYFCQEGFSEQFLQKENSLIIRSQDGSLCRDPDGNVSLECTCGLVISGNPDPENPLFTPKGSFWTNDATPLLDLAENQDPRTHPRNVCIDQGYASIALVPLRANRRIIGLLQLNDRRKGQFKPEVIELLEAMAAGIGEVLLRRRTEEKLIKAQEHYRIVADFTYDWEWWVGPDGKYIYVSPSCERITGYTQQEFIGEADLLEDIILPEDRHIWQEHQKNSLIGHIPGEVQFRIMRKDGAVRWIEHACQPVKDDTGRFLGVRGSNRDISNPKQAEEALREKEAELRESRDFIRDLTNSLPDSVYSVSMPERTIEWGNEAVRQLGYEVEECVGRTTEFLYATKEDYLAYGEKLAQAFAAGKDTFETEVLFRKKSGEVFPAEVRVSLFRVNGRLVKVTGIVKDISERKKKEHELERYQQRLKALTSQLTIAEENERRSIAADLHDHVGQSLALARMQIASVRKRITEPGQTAVLDEISDTLHQTLHQTRELIYELSPPQLNEIGLSAAIREWLEEQVEKRQGIQTECIDNGLELKLEQDLRVILFRCVRELLTNVVKHAQATRVKVHVNKVNDLLEIIVSDNGRGFHAGATEQFLTPQGGFGLFSVRERMADFGGAAEISSEPGQGTHVILRVPVK
jgi:PAS domain S-box-containing protein